MKISDTALLSGYFTYAGAPSAADGWVPVAHTSEEEALLANFYFKKKCVQIALKNSLILTISDPSPFYKPKL